MTHPAFGGLSVLLGIALSSNVSAFSPSQAGNDEPIKLLSAEGDAVEVKKTTLTIAKGDRSNLVLTIPEKLRNSALWSVRRSDDQRRLILSTERGVAFWRNAPPHQLLHVWDATTEPLAGPKGPGYTQNGPWRYDHYKLMLGFNVSPDGTRVCIHALSQTAHDFKDSKDGVVIVRDLESGKDVARLEHPNEGQVLDKIFWSRDSRRLATEGSYSDVYKVNIWKLPEPDSKAENAKAVKLATIPGYYEDVVFAANDEHIYLLTESFPKTLSMRKISDGSVVGLCDVKDGIRMIHLSPDGRNLVAVVAGTGGFFIRGDALHVLDPATLKTRWSGRCQGAIFHIAHRKDGKVVAVAWGIPNEIFGSTAGAKAWDDTGAVVLDQKTSWVNGLGFTPEGRLQAGSQIFEVKSPSKK